MFLNRPLKYPHRPLTHPSSPSMLPYCSLTDSLPCTSFPLPFLTPFRPHISLPYCTPCRTFTHFRPSKPLHHGFTPACCHLTLRCSILTHPKFALTLLPHPSTNRQQAPTMSVFMYLFRSPMMQNVFI